MAGSQLKVWDKESMEGTASVLRGQMQRGFSYLYPLPPAVRRLQKFLL